MQLNPAALACIQSLTFAFRSNLTPMHDGPIKYFPLEDLSKFSDLRWVDPVDLAMCQLSGGNRALMIDTHRYLLL